MSVSDSYIEVARIVKAHGLRGELKLLLYTESAEDLAQYDSFWIAHDGKMIGQFQVERLRAANRAATIKLAGIDDLTAAEGLRDCALFILESQLPPPSDGQYYIRDLIGMRVVSESGALLGTLNDVLELPANDVYQIIRDSREILLPAIPEVILNIQLNKRLITVRLPDGLSDSDS